AALRRATVRTTCTVAPPIAAHATASFVLSSGLRVFRGGLRPVAARQARFETRGASDAASRPDPASRARQAPRPRLLDTTASAVEVVPASAFFFAARFLAITGPFVGGRTSVAHGALRRGRTSRRHEPVGGGVCRVGHLDAHATVDPRPGQQEGAVVARPGERG